MTHRNAPIVEARRRIQDSRFLVRMGLPRSPLTTFVGYVGIASERARRAARRHREDAILNQFTVYIQRHYGPHGRGYEDLAAMPLTAKKERYGRQTPRLADFVDTWNDLLRYNDGDSFADLGCGTGQNIKTLVAQFPHSPVLGIDVSQGALDFVAEVETAPHLRLAHGSITNLEQLDALLSSPVDHIVLSHVFSTLIDASVYSTKDRRQELVRLLVSKARKSVIIIDAFSARGDFTVEIEQRDRAVVFDDVLSYFESVGPGRAVLVRSPRTEAVIYQAVQPPSIAMT